jgi:hypothetical protein
MIDCAIGRVKELCRTICLHAAEARKCCSENTSKVSRHRMDSHVGGSCSRKGQHAAAAGLRTVVLTYRLHRSVR